jgi:hypothetical protein
MEKEENKECEHSWELDDKKDIYDYQVDELKSIIYIFICKKCGEAKTSEVKIRE